MSDARYLTVMTVDDWRQRVSNLRALLIEAERQLECAECERISNSPLVQAVLEANRQPVK